MQWGECTILCGQQLHGLPHTLTSLPSAEPKGLMKNRGLGDTVNLCCFPIEENYETDKSLAFSTGEKQKVAGVRDKASARIVSEANNICNGCHYLIQCSAAAGVLEDVRLFQTQGATVSLTLAREI